MFNDLIISIQKKLSIEICIKLLSVTTCQTMEIQDESSAYKGHVPEFDLFVA